MNIIQEDLERYYIDEKRSMAEISRIYGCNWRTIKSKLKNYKISVRPKGAFLVDDDGETFNSKFNRGEISWKSYRNGLSKNVGFEDFNEYNRKMNHEKGKCLPMNENKECSAYLGIYICENKEFISKIINIIENMPYGNPGYDIICSKNKKVDVKCSCLRNNNTWIFVIDNNKIADYFLMISFDNRENLNVQHIWLVKGDSVIEKTTYNSKEFIFNEKDGIFISKGKRSLKRWIKYEVTDTYKLEEAQKLCDKFKNDDKCKIEKSDLSE